MTDQPNAEPAPEIPADAVADASAAPKPPAKLDKDAPVTGGSWVRQANGSLKRKDD